MPSRAENVQHLRGLGDRMQISGTSRGDSGPRGLPGRIGTSIPKRTLRRPSTVPDRLGPPPTGSERRRGVDGVPWPGIPGPGGFEQRQRGRGTGHGIPGDRPQLIHRQLHVLQP